MAKQVMIMKKMVVLLLLLAACAVQDSDMQSGTIVLRTYGAFTLPEMQEQVLTINSTHAILRYYGPDDVQTFENISEISQEEYDSLVTLFREEGFQDMQPLYEPEEGDLIVTDVGTAEFTVVTKSGEKTVKVDPYWDEYMPEGLARINDKLAQIKGELAGWGQPTVEEIAEEYIITAPTYAYDGYDLQLLDHVILESFPEQHVLTYSFSSLQAGYGDRSDSVSAQVITDHEIVVKVVDGEVVSAIIDERWDEMTQEEMDQPASDEPDQSVSDEPDANNSFDVSDPNTSGKVTMKLQQMQCDEMPWQAWYREGGANFIKEPTESELVIAYLGDHVIDASDFNVIESGRMVCQACSVCPTSYYYTIKVSGEDADRMSVLGWERL